MSRDDHKGCDGRTEFNTMAQHRLIGHETRHVASTGSTMDDVAALASDGTPEGVVLVAGEQTAGRGRYERAWVSQPGDDLLFSILFRPRPAIATEINMAVTLAISEVVEQMCGSPTTIKWPNDVRVAGAKIAGVLHESRQDASGLSVVTGVGLNVNSHMSQINPGGTSAVSMCELARRPLDTNSVLEEVLGRVDAFYRLAMTGSTNFPAWRDRIDTVGEHVDVTFAASGGGNNVTSGIAEDIDSSGRLIVRDSDGRLWPVSAGEVTLRPALPASDGK